MDDYLNYLKHYPAYSKEDIRYYNTLSKHKRIIEHEEHLWKELTDAWVWKECWGDFDSVEESINMSKKMQLYYVDLPFAFFLSPPGEKGGNALWEPVNNGW